MSNQPSYSQMKVAIVAAGLANATDVERYNVAQIKAKYAQLVSGQTRVADASGTSVAGEANKDHEDPSRQEKPGGLAGMQRKVATTSQLRQVVEELLKDGDALGEAVQAKLLEMQGQLRDALGVDAQIEAKMMELLSLLTGEQAEQQEKLMEWMQQVEAKATTTLRVELPDQPIIELKDQHEKFADLLFNCVLRLPTLLVGPTGSGKTRAGMEVAKALKLPYAYVALGPTQTEGKLSGFTNAVGHLVPSEFYLTYRYGGVLMLDEMDAGNPSVLLWMNGAVQNRLASFPRGYMTRLEYDGYLDEAKEFEENYAETGGMVKMHEDAVLLASANTFGKGADMMYVGRQAIDAATFKRFKFIIWDYDESLELKISPLDPWTKVVQAVRHCVQAKRMNHAVSTVDSIDGGKMILAGKPWQTVAAETIFAGLQQDEIDKLINDTQHKAAIKKAMDELRAWERRREQEQAKGAKGAKQPQAEQAVN